MTHTLTVYGKNVRVVVQTRDLNFKQAAEAAAHFKRTVYQVIIDAPHVGTQREHLQDEFTDDTPPEKAPRGVAPTPHPRIKPPPKAPATAKTYTRPVDDVTPKGRATEAAIAKGVASVATDRAGRPLKTAKKAKKGGKKAR